MRLGKEIREPNHISSMSDHAEGSSSFVRYREVDMDIKQDVIKGLE